MMFCLHSVYADNPLKRRSERQQQKKKILLEVPQKIAKPCIKRKQSTDNKEISSKNKTPVEPGMMRVLHELHVHIESDRRSSYRKLPGFRSEKQPTATPLHIQTILGHVGMKNDVAREQHEPLLQSSSLIDQQETSISCDVQGFTEHAIYGEAEDPFVYLYQSE